MLGIYTKEIMIIFFFALSFLLGSNGSDPSDHEPQNKILKDKAEEI